MHIQLHFDRDKLNKYAERGSPLVFEIAWEHEGLYYPASNWSDFGAVVLVWWLRALVELLEGSDKAMFLFMDGPYGLEAHYLAASRLVELTPRSKDWKWSIPLDVLAKELIRAANTVSRELLTAGVGRDDRYSLEHGVTRVRNAIHPKN